MYKLNFKKRVWIVKQRLRGVSPSKLALSQGVSDRTVREIVTRYKELGWEGYNNNRPYMSLNYKTPQKVGDELTKRK